MSAAFRNTSVFQTMTDPRYYPRPDSPEEREEELSFDADVEPTEHECNTCGWRGQTPARTSYPWGTVDRRYCPTCQKWTETPEEWNLLPADPFEYPPEYTAMEASDAPVPERPPAAEQLKLFPEAA